MKPSLLVIAGEASADINTAEVLLELRKRLPSLSAFGVGGPHMAALGFEIIAPASDFSVVGLTEVSRMLPKITRGALRILKAAARRRPTAALLIDLPDLNARLGPILSKMGIPILYMGAPQAWAWREGRARKMARWVRYLGCFFPFESTFFQDRGVNAHFVGHPRVPAAKKLRQTDPGQNLVIMPGSRNSELSHHLPVLRQAIPMLAGQFPDLSLVLPVAPDLNPDRILTELDSAANHVQLHHGDALSALKDARLAWVASGTAVTEALLMHVPTIVFYRLSRVTFAIAQKLVRVPHIAMTNLLADERLVPELVQDDFNAHQLIRHTHELLESESRYCQLRERLIETATQLERTDATAAELVTTEIVRLCVTTSSGRLDKTAELTALNCPHGDVLTEEDVIAAGGGDEHLT